MATKGTVSIFEEKESSDQYDLKDRNAIREIIFNGTKQEKDINGTVRINNYLDDVFKDKDVLALTVKDAKSVEDIEDSTNKKITFEITDEESLRKERTLFAINEGEKYSLIMFKNDRIVNLSKTIFEDENLDFDYITNSKIYNSMFTSYENFYNFLNDGNLTDKNDYIKDNNNSSSKYQTAFIYDSTKYFGRDKYIVYIIYGDTNKIYCYKLLEYLPKEAETYKYELGNVIIDGEDYIQPSKADEVYLTTMNILVRKLNDPRME